MALGKVGEIEHAKRTREHTVIDDSTLGVRNGSSFDASATIHATWHTAELRKSTLFDLCSAAASSSNSILSSSEHPLARTHVVLVFVELRL